jgi:hypothetical protein
MVMLSLTLVLTLLLILSLTLLTLLSLLALLTFLSRLLAFLGRRIDTNTATLGALGEKAIQEVVDLLRSFHIFFQSCISVVELGALLTSLQLLLLFGS